MFTCFEIAYFHRCMGIPVAKSKPFEIKALSGTQLTNFTSVSDLNKLCIIIINCSKSVVNAAESSLLKLHIRD